MIACARSFATLRLLRLPAILGILLASVAAGRSAAVAPDEQSIRQVVEQAETSELTLPYPQIGALAADNAQVQDAQIRSSAILASFYAPSSPRLATRDTLHLLTQMVGKGKLELCPFLNQWWEVTFQLSARGLTTGLSPRERRPSTSSSTSSITN